MTLRRVDAALRRAALAALLLAPGCSTFSRLTERGLTTDSRMHVAEVAEAGGDTDTALSMYSAAVRNDPKSPSAQIGYARALARQGRLEQARQSLQLALKAAPTQPDLQREYAALDVMAGNVEDAHKRLERLTTAKGRDPDAMIDAGVALDLLGRSAEAREMYARALRLRPGDVAASNDLAMSHLLDANFREARDVLEPFRDREDIPARMRNNLAIAHAGLGDLAAARAVSRGGYTDAQFNDVVAALRARAGTGVPTGAPPILQ